MPVYYYHAISGTTTSTTSPMLAYVTMTATTAVTESPIIWMDGATASSTVSTCGYSNYATASPYWQRHLEREAMMMYTRQQVQHLQYDRMRAEQARTLRHHTQEAKDRARELLLDHLTPKQRRTLEKNKWFVVRGGKSRTRYRIEARETLVANIAVLRGHMVSHRLCGHCGLREVPLGDHLLAQKLMLESAEDEFLSVANRHAA